MGYGPPQRAAEAGCCCVCGWGAVWQRIASQGSAGAAVRPCPTAGLRSSSSLAPAAAPALAAEIGSGAS